MSLLIASVAIFTYFIYHYVRDQAPQLKPAKVVAHRSAAGGAQQLPAKSGSNQAGRTLR